MNLRGGVEHIDENKTQSYQENYSGRNYILKWKGWVRILVPMFNIDHRPSIETHFITLMQEFGKIILKVKLLICMLIVLNLKVDISIWNEFQVFHLKCVPGFVWNTHTRRLQMPVCREPYRGNDEGNPAHGDKHCGWKVNTEDEWSDGSCQLYFKPIDTVVT